MSIHAACAAGDLKTLQELVGRGQHINARDSDGLTPLHWACLTGKIDVVKWLVSKKVFKNNRDSKGLTPLLYAAREGHLDIVKYLLAEKAFTFVVDNDGNTALHAAAQKQHRDVVEALLTFGADASILNNEKKLYSDYLVQPTDVSVKLTKNDSRGNRDITDEDEICDIKVQYKSDVVSVRFRTSDTWNMLIEHLNKALPCLSESTLSHFVIVDNDGEAESNELRSMAKLLKAYHKIYNPTDMYFQVFASSSIPNISPLASDKKEEVRQLHKIVSLISLEC